jgi:chloride channel 2
LFGCLPACLFVFCELSSTIFAPFSRLGFSIGKEGPFVHIVAMVCEQLTRLPCFRRIREVRVMFCSFLLFSFFFFFFPEDALTSDSYRLYPPFRYSHLQNDASFIEVLSAACANGVTLSFGSPIGGALFSIEVTSSFYLVSNLWKGFFVSATGAMLLTAINQFGMERTICRGFFFVFVLFCVLISSVLSFLTMQ